MQPGCCKKKNSAIAEGLCPDPPKPRKWQLSAQRVLIEYLWNRWTQRNDALHGEKAQSKSYEELHTHAAELLQTERHKILARDRFLIKKNYEIKKLPKECLRKWIESFRIAKERAEHFYQYTMKKKKRLHIISMKE